MKTNIVPIGNSKGVRIPKVILEQCCIKKNIFMEVEDNKIIIRPVKRNPRQHWEAFFKKMLKNRDDKLIIDDKIDLEAENWEWE
ncbi:MAG: AbrB/MazE/SpoVT family DNA-binding domain-containing protein [Candidatus Edwardsbacteria bacterium]